MAEEYKELYNEVFSTTTIAMLRGMLPNDYKEEVNCLLAPRTSAEDKLARIDQVLEEEKNATLNGVEDMAVKKRSPVNNEKKFRNNPRGPVKLSNSVDSRHDCSKDKACNPNWDLLGCSELYRLDNYQARIDFLRECKHCWKCGAPHAGPSFHRCSWFNGKIAARCTALYNNRPCNRAAAVCLEHQNNASTELKNWLARINIKFVVGVVMNPILLGSKVGLYESVAEEFKEYQRFLSGDSIEEKYQRFLKIKQGNLMPQYQGSSDSREKLVTQT